MSTIEKGLSLKELRRLATNARGHYDGVAFLPYAVVKNLSDIEVSRMCRALRHTDTMPILVLRQESACAAPRRSSLGGTDR